MKSWIRHWSSVTVDHCSEHLKVTMSFNKNLSAANRLSVSIRVTQTLPRAGSMVDLVNIFLSSSLSIVQNLFALS